MDMVILLLIPYAIQISLYVYHSLTHMIVQHAWLCASPCQPCLEEFYKPAHNSCWRMKTEEGFPKQHTYKQPEDSIELACKLDNHRFIMICVCFTLFPVYMFYLKLYINNWVLMRISVYKYLRDFSFSCILFCLLAYYL